MAAQGDTGANTALVKKVPTLPGTSEIQQEAVAVDESNTISHGMAAQGDTDSNTALAVKNPTLPATSEIQPEVESEKSKNTKRKSHMTKFMLKSSVKGPSETEHDKSIPDATESDQDEVLVDMPRVRETESDKQETLTDVGVQISPETGNDNPKSDSTESTEKDPVVEVQNVEKRPRRNSLQPEAEVNKSRPRRKRKSSSEEQPEVDEKSDRKQKDSSKSKVRYPLSYAAGLKFR